MPAANFVAYTAPINPSGASPTLTRSRIWAGLELKINSGETFVGGAITNTDVITTGTTERGLAYTDREVTFREGNRKVKEHCIKFEPMKVEFHQPNGSVVQNIISEGKGGKEDLYMTYSFEWLHPELDGDEKGLAEQKVKEEKMAQTAVESTIEVMRRLANEGKI
jgi:hypothetical protein